MPTAPHRTVVPPLIPLLAATLLLLCATACLLGGTPLGRPSTRLYATPTDGAAAPPSSTTPITTVVIDAGHGGEDGGASSASMVVEKDVNLSVAFALRDLLEAAGIPVVMTRTEDKLLYDRNVNFQGRKKVLDLAARRLIAERAAEAAAAEGGGSLFVSIHMNAFPAPQYSGMQVWYSTGDPLSKDIADSIQAASLPLMPENRRQTKAAGSGIYLLHRIQTPAVLVECGFLSNPAEADRLADPRYQNALAAAILLGTSSHLAPKDLPADP